MATITLTYDSNNEIAQKTIAYILSLGVFKTKKQATKKEESPYNPEFVEMILRAHQEEGGVTLSNIEEIRKFCRS